MAVVEVEALAQALLATHDVAWVVGPDGVLARARSHRLDSTAVPGIDDAALRAYASLQGGESTVRSAIRVSESRELHLTATALAIDGHAHALVVGELNVDGLAHVVAALDGRTLGSLRCVLSDIAVGVVVHDRYGGVLLANRSALEMLGAADEASLEPTKAIELGLVSFEYDQHDGRAHPVTLALQSGERLYCIARSRDPVDEPRRLLCSVVPRPGTDGRPELVVCSFTDVTELHRALGEREREHELLQLVMHTSVAGICVLDTTGAIVYANRAAEEILGLSRDELLSRTYDAPQWKPTDLSGGPWPDEAQPFVRVMRTKRPVLDVRHSIAWPDGTRKDLSINGAPILDARGEIEQLVFAILDISEQTEAARARERMQAEAGKLSRLESLAVLAGGVAHDFNNLLVGILTAASLALETLDAAHPARTDVQLIEQAARRAAELTRQLLAYSGCGKFVVSPIDLSALVHDMSQLLQALVAKGVQVAWRLAEGLPTIEADETQVRQIVMNLVLNASDAIGPAGGTVIVGTALVHATRAELMRSAIAGDRLPEGDYVVLEVRDDGGGMTPETMARIFDPFYTTKPRGHGLGLAAVLGVVRGHRGFVEVASEVGRGAAFRIGLPVSSRSLGRADANETVEGPIAIEGTILVVDDEELVRGLTARVLARAGARTMLANDGEQALAMFAAHRDEITAVVLDVTMPKLRGDVVLAELRQLAPSLPVVLMSGFVDAAAEIVSQGDVYTVFVPKPFRSRELLETLHRILRRG